MAGLKPKWLELINLLDMKGFGDPSYVLYKLREIYNVLEDVYSVGSMVELQEAIDSIGTGAGTIFIEAGTHQITAPIDIDNSGSIIIYGHGDNTILLPNDGITVFNITDTESCVIKTLQIDASNYTGATSSVIVNEINNNVISFEDVSIVGNNVGNGIELQSNNCVIEHCVINNVSYGIYVNSDENVIGDSVLNDCANYCVEIRGDNNSILDNTINGVNGVELYSNTYTLLIGNIISTPAGYAINIDGGRFNTITGNTFQGCQTGINTGDVVSGVYANFNVITGNSFYNIVGYATIIYHSDRCVIVGNNFNGGSRCHICLWQADYCTVSGNICTDMLANDGGGGQFQGGINIIGSNYNSITGNVSYNNNNTGAGVAYGLRVGAGFGFTSTGNTVGGNILNGNEVDFSDGGIDTVIFGSGWSGWFDDGVNFRVTVADGVITAVDNSVGGGHNP